MFEMLLNDFKSVFLFGGQRVFFSRLTCSDVIHTHGIRAFLGAQPRLWTSDEESWDDLRINLRPSVSAASSLFVVNQKRFGSFPYLIEKVN